MIIAALLCWASQHRLIAQDPAADDSKSTWQSKLWLSGQINAVGQFYPPFPATYSGAASFSANGDAKPTSVATIYTGYALTEKTELFLDLESAHGSGVSGALGLGGLENLDVTGGSAAPYVARAMLRQIIPLSQKKTGADRNPLGLATAVPERRLELRLGKMSLTDFFDLNAVGSDSHLQFLNFAIDNNATYDYAANSRGYTYALLAEFYEPNWALRFAEAFQPRNANGQGFDWDLARSSSENVEGEISPRIKGKQPFTLRGLAFFSHKMVGDYKAAVNAYRNGLDSAPSLENHLLTGTAWGLGINGETSLPAGARLFGRLGWTPGRKEAFQFAEADRTLALGGDIGGKLWRRSHDKVGLAWAIDGLSTVHRSYLESGGQSYLLGDGGLDYAREKILEFYYNVPLWHSVFGAFDIQRIWNPGYNQARGPVLIFGLRLHLEGDIHFN